MSGTSANESAPARVDVSETTICHFPHAFITKRGEAVLIRTLDDRRRRGLLAMYLAFRPRNSFSGLPPITDAACTSWVEGMMDRAINLVALSFEAGVVGHGALFGIDASSCEQLTVVAPAQQRAGIGTELVRCLIQLAHELDYEQIKLCVDAQNHVARHVYRKCGFEYASAALAGELDMRLDLGQIVAGLDVPVRRIMQRRVVSVRPRMTCREALEIFLNAGIATLPVIGDRGELAGILSETDLMTEANLPKRVAEVLTREVVTVTEGCPLAKVVSLFRSRKLRCIPVVDRRGRLVGIVGRRDILAHYLRRAAT